MALRSEEINFKFKKNVSDILSKEKTPPLSKNAKITRNYFFVSKLFVINCNNLFLKLLTRDIRR